MNLVGQEISQGWISCAAIFFLPLPVYLEFTTLKINCFLFLFWVYSMTISSENRWLSLISKFWPRRKYGLTKDYVFVKIIMFLQVSLIYRWTEYSCMTLTFVLDHNNLSTTIPHFIPFFHGYWKIISIDSKKLYCLYFNITTRNCQLNSSCFHRTIFQHYFTTGVSTGGVLIDLLNMWVRGTLQVHLFD